LVQNLAGSNSGATGDSLRVSSLSLVFSVAELCSTARLNSCHTKLVDVQLNCTMRIISGTLKSTKNEWLPVLSNIEPPDLRRKHMAKNLINNCNLHQNSVLYEVLNEYVLDRLLSKKPIWKTLEEISLFNLDSEWRKIWEDANLLNHEILDNPSIKLSGFDWSRRVGVGCNLGRCGHWFFK
jgi:hypothetical protein